MVSMNELKQDMITGMGYIGLDSGRLYRMRRGPKLIEAVASGTTIIINDAADGRPFRGLRVFGRSIQDGTPSVENPVPIVNAGENGSIKVEVTGRNLIDYTKAKGDADVQFIDGGFIVGGDARHRIINIPFKFKKDKSYTTTFKCETLIGLGNINIYLPGGKYSVSGKAKEQYGIISNKPFVPLDEYTAIGFYVSLENTDTTKFKITDILLVETGTDTTYELYKKLQSLTLQTPNGLPGVPVTKDGNYTDQNGQQWVCDEIDLGRGKYVQRTAEKDVLEAIPSLWSGAGKWENNDGYKTLAFYAYINGANSNKDWGAVKNYGICNYATITSNVFNNSIIGFSLGDYIAFRVSRNLLPDWDENNPSNDPWVNWLKARKEAGNPVIVRYALKTSIERDLTPEEIAAYKALRTYGSTTVVSNDAGVHMEVTYVADTKAYIDKKFKELNQAIVNTQIALL